MHQSSRHPVRALKSIASPTTSLTHKTRLTLASLLLLAATLTLGAGLARAEGPAIFKAADLALGEKLIRENKCVECHIGKVGGDGSAIYKPAGKINTAGLLRGMVEMCNTNMNLGLFPEEVTAVAAVMNRDHYKFK